jgi:hypothetical protein
VATGRPKATVIRDVSGSELRLFGEIVARLERLGAETDARAVIFNDVIRLLRGDFGASYVWKCAQEFVRRSRQLQHGAEQSSPLRRMVPVSRSDDV